MLICRDEPRSRSPRSVTRLHPRARTIGYGDGHCRNGDWQEYSEPNIIEFISPLYPYIPGDSWRGYGWKVYPVKFSRVDIAFITNVIGIIMIRPIKNFS